MVTRIVNEHAKFDLAMGNHQNFTRYLIQAICADSSTTINPHFISRWLSLSKMVVVPPVSPQAATLNPGASFIIQTVDGEPELSDPYLSQSKSTTQFTTIQPTDESKGTSKGDGLDIREFSEEPLESVDLPQRFDIWVIPFGPSSVSHHTSHTSTLLLIFRYFQEEFIDIAWLRAMKRFASILGLNDYTPSELEDWFRLALRTWEDNVDKHPNNPIMISRLADAYADLGDLKLEIAGWWRLVERHPTNLSFLKFLHRSSVANHSLQPGLRSLLYFTRLCTLYFLERKAEEHGFGHLDWWPFAEPEDFMIFQPYREKIEWVLRSTKQLLTFSAGMELSATSGFCCQVAQEIFLVPHKQRGHMQSGRTFRKSNPWRIYSLERQSYIPPQRLCSRIARTRRRSNWNSRALYAIDNSHSLQIAHSRWRRQSPSLFQTIRPISNMFPLHLVSLIDCTKHLSSCRTDNTGKTGP